MKKDKIQTCLVFASLLTVLSLAGCQDKLLQTYEVNNPVYMSYEDLRTAVADTAPVEISLPGKIYLYGEFILVNEVRKGIHVVNNADPANPEVISFIKIPGNIDMAIKNKILYADSYVDLVAIDISDLNNNSSIIGIFSIFVPFFSSSLGAQMPNRKPDLKFQQSETSSLFGHFREHPQYPFDYVSEESPD